MEFRILGPLEVRDGGAPLPIGGGRQRALLALLLLNANRVVPVKRLVDDLWGENVPGTASKAVQIYVSKLRKVLPKGRLETRPPGYLIQLEDGELDLWRLERLLAEGRHALAEGKAQEAASHLREALSLWRGPALAEFTEPFAQPASARLEELRLACLEERIEADLALRGRGELVGELEALVARHPLRERLRAQQMLALYRSGRQAEALSVYQESRRLLDEELGIEPSQRLRDLERRILQQDPELDRAAEAPPARPAGEPTQRRVPAPAKTPSLSSRTLVGRGGELGRLRCLLDEALAGYRQVVFVSGPAGIGKTTLVEAFLTEAEANGALVGHGQCFEQYGAGEAYMPVLEALGRLCRGSHGDEIVAVLADRAPTWLSQMPGIAEAAGGAMAASDAGTTPQRMLRELVEALEAITELRPLALLLEDLHWSDPSTIDVVSALARRDDSARLLLLATYRPQDARADSHRVWETAHELHQRGLASEIGLGSLTPCAVVDYLELRFPENEFPLDLSAVLHDRTDGNPLFLDRVVESWVESGSIAGGEGVWTLQAPVAQLSVDVPATIRQLIEHQLDKLDRPDRELVEAASVAGSEFVAAVVAAACRRAEDEVETRFMEFARQGRFVEALDEAVWPDGTVSTHLGFVHDLYAEVAYAAVPPGRRARLHRDIGSRLESAYGEGAGEIASELAAHFERAYDPDLTSRYLGLAAEQALERRALREAIEHLTRAIDALAELPDDRSRRERELALRISLGNTLMAARGYAAPEVKDTYTRAQDLCQMLDDRARLPPVLYGLWVNSFVAGKHRAACELGAEFLKLMQETGDPAVVVAHRALGWPLVSMGRFVEGRAHLEEAVGSYDRERDRPLGVLYGQDPGVAAGATLAWALWFLGFPEQAVARSAQAVDTARDLDQPIALAYALACDAMLRQLRREAGPALHQADEAVALATRDGMTLWRAWASVPRGWALSMAAEHEEAIATIREGIACADETGSAWSRPYFLAMLAEAHRSAGQLDAALACVDEALVAAEASDERCYEAEIHRLRGELLYALPKPRGDEAAEAFSTALEVARRQEAKMLELRAAVSLGRLWVGQRRAAEAHELVSGVHAWFTEGFDTPDLRDAAVLLRSSERLRQNRMSGLGRP